MTSCMNIEGIHTHIDDLYALHTYCKSNYLFHEKPYLAEQGPEIWNHTF